MPGNLRITNKLYPPDYYKEASTLAIKLPMNNPKFDKSSQLFNMSFTTEEQAISNYINLLLTRDGERFMQPGYGVGLLYYIFEQNVDAVRIILLDKIREQTATWLPYIDVVDIRVTGVDNRLSDENSVNIEIIFKVMNSKANRTITFTGNDTQDIFIEVA